MANAIVTEVVATVSAVPDRLRQFVRDLMLVLREINLTGLSAQVAYSLIFAMPSILLMVAVIAQNIDERTGFFLSAEMRALVVGTLPSDVQPVVIGLIDDAMVRAREGPSTLSAIVAIVVALLAAGNGFGELATAFDRAAQIDDPRPAWQKRFIFTVSGMLIAMTLIVAFTFYVWGADLIALLSARFRLPGDWADGWLALQGLVILLLVFLGTSVLYMTSSGRYCFPETAPGAAVATLLWLLIVKGFQFYLQLANPGTAYGAASSILVFLVFLYLTSMGLIIGAMSAAVIVRGSRRRGRVKLQTAALLQRLRPRQTARPEPEPGGPRGG